MVEPQEDGATAPAASLVYAGVVGTLEQFDAKSESMSAYLERATVYMDANNVPPSKRAATLLSAIGKSTFHVLRNLLAPAKLHEQSFDDIVKALLDHFEPKPLVISERFHFNKRQQGPTESVADFVAELRRLSVHCEFGPFLDDALRDRFVCGLRDEGAQKKLLVETKLTFSRAVEIAQSMETAATKTRQLQRDGLAEEMINRASPDNPPTACYRCGRDNHTPTSCPFKNARCHNCGKLGHIKDVCRSESRGNYRGRRGSRRGSRGRGRPGVRILHEEEEEEEPLDLGAMNAGAHHVRSLNQVSQKPNHPYIVELSVDGVPLAMEIDTGACVSLISEQTFNRLFPNKTLEATNTRLSAYSGHALTTLGVLETDVSYGEQRETLPLVVVAGTGPTLLGRNWLSTIRLDWKSIGAIAHQSPVTPLLHKYSEVFDGTLGKLVGHEAKIHVDPSAQPRYCPARTVPYALRDSVEAELQRLQKEGIIEPIQFADWAAPIVPVLKADKKSIRICGDFKQTVNTASKLDRYPIPRIEDLFAKLSGGKTFTKLDMSQAYQQIALEEESRKYVVINTHKGLFRYNRLPFGVSSAPGIFQRVMESLLNGIPHVVVYLDDILVTGPTEEAHVTALEEVLKRLKAAGLRLRKDKCVFMAPSVTYLGHRIDAQGLHPLPDKVRAIQEAPRPQSVSKLKSYLGLLSYYSKFLPNLATVLAPLYGLLRRYRKWRWTRAHTRAFEQSKKLLLSSQVLVHFDPRLDIRLACDASEYGIGAVLSHLMPDGVEKPVGFVSRTLTEAEKKYSQVEKEALACVVGVTRFRSYLWGHHFTLQTDHKPLLSLLNEHKAIPQQAANRIQRWAWILSAYDYTITWRSTSQHANADALSRLPLSESPRHSPVPAELVLMMEQLQEAPITAIQIAAWTRRDPLMARVMQHVQRGWPENTDETLRPYWHKKVELSVEAGCLIWGGRVVIPPQGRQSILAELHCGHPGASRMKSLARGLVWWPGIDKDIESAVKLCSNCQQNQAAPPSAPLQPWAWPTRPWSRLHVDYAGPVEGKMLLIVIDAHSKWIEAIPLSTATAGTTVQQLQKLFAQFGLPETIVSDNGPQFAALEFQRFCKANGVQHTLIAPYHPSSNGLAERAVRIVKQGLKKLDKGSLSDRLTEFLFQYRITPQTTTGSAPAELLLGRKPRSRLDLLKPSIEKQVQKKQAQQKTNHDKRSKLRRFQIGETVFVRNHAQGDRWLPGIITEETGPLSFKVTLPGGRVRRCHMDHLRPRTVVENSRDDGEWDSPSIIPPAVDESMDVHQPSTESAREALEERQEETTETAESLPTNVPTPVMQPQDTPTPLPTLQPTPRTYPQRARAPPNWYHHEYC